jgi:hypothetical protein
VTKPLADRDHVDDGPEQVNGRTVTTKAAFVRDAAPYQRR